MRAVKAIAVLLTALLLTGAALMETSLHVRRAAGAPPPEAPRVTAFDGVTLRGVFEGGGNRGCVLALHGIGDTHLGVAGVSDLLVSHGYRVLSPDSRAHGWSDGPIVTYGVLESRDVSTWIDWLQAQGCTRFFGLGESLGGSVLLQSLVHEPGSSLPIVDG